MNLTDIDKYGFPFNWFIDVYEEINGIEKALNLYFIKNKINSIYNLHYLNYTKFIDEISILLNISFDDKIKYLKKEKRCTLCKQNYPHSLEIFTTFIDGQTNENLNHTICFYCANTKYFCSNCDLSFGKEPYEHIYIYKNEIIDNKFLTICKKCYNEENIPLVDLFYKDIKINIEFNDLKK